MTDPSHPVVFLFDADLLRLHQSQANLFPFKGEGLVRGEHILRRGFGVDFNRAPPTQKDSLRMNNALKSGKIDQDAYYKYRTALMKAPL